MEKAEVGRKSLNETDWWKKAIVYQVYPRSFMDSNGDGIGDLNGITEKLPYLKELGIDVIWISPMFLSPMDDNGYDIADYYKVDPLFGSDRDMEVLIEEAKKFSIQIILDLVVNHCSDEHEWFQKAVVSEDSKEAGYFYFRRTEDGEEPNNWRSNFGGSAWSKLPDGRWYYHTFSAGQPDLNWENPSLREEIYRMINWWLDKGIAGFRVDAITFIKKDLSFASYQTEDGYRYPVENFQNYPGIGRFLEEMKEHTFQKHGCLTVAEAPGVSAEDFQKYAGKDGYFSMIFDFSWDSMEGEEDRSSMDAIERLKKRLFDSQRFISANGWCGVFLENHDQSRCVNKYLEEKDRNYYSVTALAALYFFLHGTPYIYEGQEIGMTNAVWNGIEEMDDVRAKLTWQEKVAQGELEEKLLQYYSDWGRDNARTPMQWDESRNAGFTEGIPWLKVQANYREINVESQRKNPDSVLSFYKKLIALHKSDLWEPVLAEGYFLPIMEEVPGIFAYERVLDDNIMTVIVNFTNTEVQIPQMNRKLLLNNYHSDPKGSGNWVLEPYQAIVLAGERKGRGNSDGIK